MQVIFGLGYHDHIHGHGDSLQHRIRKNVTNLFLRRIQDHSKIQIAFRPMIPPGSRSKHDDLQRISHSDYAAQHLIHLLLRHRPVVLDHTRCHKSLPAQREF